MKILTQPTSSGDAPISEEHLQLSSAELDNKLESSKTPTPDEKTEQKRRILVPENGCMDRPKVPKSPGKLNLECKTPNPDKKTKEKQKDLIPKNGNACMDGWKVPKSPAKLNLECKTQTPTPQRVKKVGGGIEFPKNSTPNRLKLPIAFKYPESYTSPTDLMISPISKGLLARSRKGALPSKMHELRNSEMSLLSQS